MQLGHLFELYKKDKIEYSWLRPVLIKLFKSIDSCNTNLSIPITKAIRYSTSDQ